MGAHGDNKKSILTKLFKGGPPKANMQHPSYIHQGVNSSFNEQLMN